jgi:hypothetical protein
MYCARACWRTFDAFLILSSIWRPYRISYFRSWSSLKLRRLSTVMRRGTPSGCMHEPKRQSNREEKDRRERTSLPVVSAGTIMYGTSRPFFRERLRSRATAVWNMVMRSFSAAVSARAAATCASICVRRPKTYTSASTSAPDTRSASDPGRTSSCIDADHFSTEPQSWLISPCTTSTRLSTDARRLPISFWSENIGARGQGARAGARARRARPSRLAWPTRVGAMWRPVPSLVATTD